MINKSNNDGRVLSLTAYLQQAQAKSVALTKDPALTDDQRNYLTRIRRVEGDRVIASTEHHLEALVAGADGLSGQNSYINGGTRSTFVERWYQAFLSGDVKEMGNSRKEIGKRCQDQVNKSRATAISFGQKSLVHSVVNNILSSKWALTQATAHSGVSIANSVAEVEKQLERSSPGSILHSHSMEFEAAKDDSAKTPSLGTEFTLSGSPRDV